MRLTVVQNSGGNLSTLVENRRIEVTPGLAQMGFGKPTVTVRALEAGEAPTASVTATGPDAQKVFAFDLGIPKGDTGARGETGRPAGFGTPAIAVTLLPSGSPPTASVTATGPDEAKVFSFFIGIPRGIVAEEG